MTAKDYLEYIVNQIHSTVVATVDENGLPVTCVIDMMYADENDLYFKRIVFNKTKVDAYVYDNLKVTGKYDYLMSSIKSGTLKKVIYDLYQKDIEKGTVNVYNNDYCFFTPN